MSPMGGKRHSGIGYNRAKKSKLPAGPRVTSSTRLEEGSDNGSSDEEAPLLHPPEPPPPPPPAELVEAVEAGAVDGARYFKKQMRRAQAATAEAQKLVTKKLRRWHKAKKTYVSSGAYSIYDGPSVAKRVRDRLFKADCDLAEARARVVQCRGCWLRLRTFLALYHRMCEPSSNDEVMRQFWERAKVRVLEPVPEPDFRDMWPGQRRNIWEWNEESYGLALTWMLRNINC